jgi:hypothetical protein
MMQHPNIDYFLFREEDSNQLIQIVLTTKKDVWTYFMILEPGGGDREDFELFAKFKLNDNNQTNGFMRYHLDDEGRGWQGKIENDEVEKGEITFFDYTPIAELNSLDKEAFNDLHKSLYEIVLQDEEDDDLIIVNDEIMEEMEDDFMWNTENWPWSDENGWIPDEFALYYLENWHGRIIDDI